jgi:hypothetical protein
MCERSGGLHGGEPGDIDFAKTRSSKNRPGKSWHFECKNRISTIVGLQVIGKYLLVYIISFSVSPCNYQG